MHILGEGVVVALQLNDNFRIETSVVFGREAVQWAFGGDVVHHGPAERKEAHFVPLQGQQSVDLVAGAGVNGFEQHPGLQVNKGIVALVGDAKLQAGSAIGPAADDGRAAEMNARRGPRKPPVEQARGQREGEHAHQRLYAADETAAVAAGIHVPIADGREGLNREKQRAQKVLPPAVRGGHAGQVVEPQDQVSPGKDHIEHHKKHHHHANKRPPFHLNEPLVGVLAVGAAAPPHVKCTVVVDGALGAARELFANTGVHGSHLSVT